MPGLGDARPGRCQAWAPAGLCSGLCSVAPPRDRMLTAAVRTCAPEHAKSTHTL